jgi:hypothetical protein
VNVGALLRLELEVHDVGAAGPGAAGGPDQQIPDRDGLSEMPGTVWMRPADMPNLVAALRARDQQLGIVVSAEHVA